MNYLDKISFLTEAERATLKQTGSPTAVALASAIEASPEAFEGFLGKERLWRLREELNRLMSLEDLRSLNESRVTDSEEFPLGVDPDRPQTEISEDPFYKLRNRIYDELRQLRSTNNLSQTAKRRIEALEKELTELLRTRAA
jgi:hypothetical protein